MLRVKRADGQIRDCLLRGPLASLRCPGVSVTQAVPGAWDTVVLLGSASFRPGSSMRAAPRLLLTKGVARRRARYGPGLSINTVR